MKKFFLTVLILYAVYVIEGCGKSDFKDLNDSANIVETKEIGDKEKASEVTEKQPEEEKPYDIEYKEQDDTISAQDEPDDIINAQDEQDETINVQGKQDSITSEQNEEEIAVTNLYFPYKEHVSLQVHAEYHNGTEFVDETARAEINRIKIYQEGSIYKLTIYIVPFMSSWDFQPDDIMNIYLYVTADKIYRIVPYVQFEPNGETVYFYDNDELLVETLDTDDKLRKNGRIVCQEEEIQEEFFSITQEENKVTYYLSETKGNGEPGQKDLYVWEKGAGLVEYGTGFGPGPIEVHIDQICEALEVK